MLENLLVVLFSREKIFYGEKNYSVLILIMHILCLIRVISLNRNPCSQIKTRQFKIETLKSVSCDHID